MIEFAVKIGNEWFFPDEKPVMVWMGERAKDMAKEMTEDFHALAAFPPHLSMTDEEQYKWMNEGREQHGIPIGKTIKDF